jgi:hypothetical protein
LSTQAEQSNFRDPAATRFNLAYGELDPDRNATDSGKRAAVTADCVPTHVVAAACLGADSVSRNHRSREGTELSR